MKTLQLCCALAIAVGAGAPVSRAQTVGGADSLDLSLDAALSRALDSSEEVMLARSQIDLAETRIKDALASAMPQISGSAGYTRTLKSSFRTGSGFSLPDSLKFEPDPSAPIEDRVQYLEDHTEDAAFGALGRLFSNLPFGQKNAYSLTLSGSQLLYSGGRTGAGLRIARSVVDAARLALREEEVTIEYDVRSAYYQALFTGELVRISADGLERARRFFEEEKLRLEAGTASDLEVMRAQVELDNLRPQLIQARNAADLAEMNLKRLANLPLDRPVRLTTRLEPPPPGERLDERIGTETLLARRASLQAAREQVSIREDQVRIARAGYLPTVSLSSGYGKLMYPSSLFAFDRDWRTDWTVSLNVQIPIFNGFRRAAQREQARVELRQAQLQVAQLQEAIQLQYEQAFGEKQRALAQIGARQGTVQQARRVYDLTELRYEKGLATQLDVFSARLSLNQARVNLAQALTDFYVADAGVDRAMGGNHQ